MQPEQPTTESPAFEGWAVAEIFGHQKYAGHMRQLALGSQVMWRIDVPAVGARRAFTKIFGIAAIFSITPCSEDIVRRLIASWQVSDRPLHVYDLAAPRAEEERDPDLPFTGAEEDAEADELNDQEDHQS